LAQHWLPDSEEPHIQALRAETFHNLGLIKFFQGELLLASNLFEQADALYQTAGDPVSFGWTMHNLNVVMQNMGEFDTAEE
jgi:hypothetical protein